MWKMQHPRSWLEQRHVKMTWGKGERLMSSGGAAAVVALTQRTEHKLRGFSNLVYSSSSSPPAR